MKGLKMKKFKYLWLSVLICIAQNVIADDSEQSISAAYESRFIKLAIRPQASKHQWQFIRSDNRVEKRTNKQGQIEVWKRDKGEISYSHIFIKQKRMVEYTSGDLRSLGQYPQWDLVKYIIDPEMLNKLQKIGDTKVKGYTASKYKGQLKGVDYEITWINDLKLPAVIRQVRNGSENSVHLKELYTQGEMPWKAIDTTNYLAMDYADLGDNEADPVWGNLALEHGHKH